MPDNIGNYILPTALGLFLIWKFAREQMAKRKIPDFIKRGAKIIDVRSPGEFQSGHGLNSINIPLDQFKKDFRQFNPNEPIILCCASGARSAMAVSLLKKNGFKEVINIGSWKNV